jgi:hypothetical protein
MSDTPRTDEAWNAVSRTPDGRYTTDVPLRQLAFAMCVHSKQLERELADMTKQRDHYKKACDQYSEDEMLCKLQEVTKQRDALAEALTKIEQYEPISENRFAITLEFYWLAHKALAATKGGSHATLQR